MARQSVKINQNLKKLRPYNPLAASCSCSLVCQSSSSSSSSSQSSSSSSSSSYYLLMVVAPLLIYSLRFQHCLLLHECSDCTTNQTHLSCIQFLIDFSINSNLEIWLTGNKIQSITKEKYDDRDEKYDWSHNKPDSSELHPVSDWFQHHLQFDSIASSLWKCNLSPKRKMTDRDEKYDWSPKRNKIGNMRNTIYHQTGSDGS